MVTKFALPGDLEAPPVCLDRSKKYCSRGNTCETFPITAVFPHAVNPSHSTVAAVGNRGDIPITRAVQN